MSYEDSMSKGGWVESDLVEPSWLELAFGAGATQRIAPFASTMADAIFGTRFFKNEEIMTDAKTADTRVWALWDGGPNYRTSSIHDGDLEIFESLQAAKDALVERFESYGWKGCQVVKADGTTSTEYPGNVTTDCEMTVYRYNPIEDGEPISDPYPDLQLRLSMDEAGDITGVTENPC